MDRDPEGFEQCEACDGYLDADDFRDGACDDCSHPIADEACNPNVND